MSDRESRNWKIQKSCATGRELAQGGLVRAGKKEIRELGERKREEGKRGKSGIAGVNQML